MLRSLVRQGIYAALGSPPAVARRLARIRRAGKITILNLHRVAEEDGSEYKPLRPRLFEQLLDFLEAHFSVVPFAGLDAPTPRPKAVLSFDDGYKDFIEVAAPILDRRGIRANLNVIPDCVERRLPPLNVLAQDFVGKAPRERVERLQLPGFSDFSSPGLGQRLSRFLKLRPRREQKALEELLVPQFFAWDGFEPTPMMTADDVRQVAARHEIGAHSYEHATMAAETDDYFAEDLDRCRAWFAEKLDQDMTVYAFPNGSCRPGQVEIALAAGVRHVLLVGEDFSDGGQVHKRITFGAGSPAEMRFRALGARRPIR